MNRRDEWLCNNRWACEFANSAYKTYSKTSIYSLLNYSEGVSRLLSSFQASAIVNGFPFTQTCGRYYLQVPKLEIILTSSFLDGTHLGTSVWALDFDIEAYKAPSSKTVRKFWRSSLCTNLKNVSPNEAFEANTQVEGPTRMCSQPSPHFNKFSKERGSNRATPIIH